MSEQQEVINLVHAHGSIRKAAKESGIPRSTLQDRYKKAIQERIEDKYEDFESPELVHEYDDIDNLLDALEESFYKRQRVENSREWMEFNMNVDGPFALAFFGDPHVDDNGCNIPLLRRDVNIVNDTPYMYGVGLGDYTNNWSGRLALKKYPDQETARSVGWELAHWFFTSIPWFLLLKGNHDTFHNEEGKGDPLEWMAEGKSVISDWTAKFQINTPNGKSYRIWAAHDFPGNSIYNPLHSGMRKAKFSGAADLYISGHKHEFACMEHEDAERGKVYWAAKARGYKYIDEYATKLGFESQKYGATITAIFDPQKEGPKALRCFSDLEEAAEFLHFKRKNS